MSKTCRSVIVPLTALLWNQRFGRSEQGSLIFENNPSVRKYLVFLTYVANVCKDENQLIITFFVVVVVLDQKETQSPVP